MNFSTTLRTSTTTTMILDYKEGVLVLDLREGSTNEGPLPELPDPGMSQSPVGEPHALLIEFGDRIIAQKEAFTAQLYAWYKWAHDHGYRFACSGPSRLLAWIGENGFQSLIPVFSSPDEALKYLSVKLPQGWPDPAAPSSEEGHCC